MTTLDFFAAVRKYADDVGADHVAVTSAHARTTENGAVVGAWMEQPPAARVHRTVWLPYVARVRIAADLGLVVVPDAMTEHVTAAEWEEG